MIRHKQERGRERERERGRERERERERGGGGGRERVEKQQSVPSFCLVAEKGLFCEKSIEMPLQSNFEIVNSSKTLLP